MIARTITRTTSKLRIVLANASLAQYPQGGGQGKGWPRSTEPIHTIRAPLVNWPKSISMPKNGSHACWAHAVG